MRRPGVTPPSGGGGRGPAHAPGGGTPSEMPHLPTMVLYPVLSDGTLHGDVARCPPRHMTMQIPDFSAERAGVSAGSSVRNSKKDSNHSEFAFSNSRCKIILLANTRNLHLHGAAKHARPGESDQHSLEILGWKAWRHFQIVWFRIDRS